VDGTATLKHRGEALLLAGLVAWSFAFAPYFPTLWRTGQFYIGPVALILLLASMWLARDRDTSILHQALSLLLLLVALGAFYCSCLQTVSLAHRIFPPPLGAEEPTFRDWQLTVGAWLLSAVLWVFWLRSWTNWPKQRCYFWGAVVFGVHIATMIGFWLILQTGAPRNLCIAYIAPGMVLAANGPARSGNVG